MLGNNERHSEKIKWYMSVWSSSNFEVDINNIYFLELIMITTLTTFKTRKRQQNINIQQKILFYQKIPFSTTISNLNKFNTIIRNFEIAYFKKVHWNFYSYSVILQTTFVILAELISSQDLTCVWVTGEKTVSFIIFNAALSLCLHSRFWIHHLFYSNTLYVLMKDALTNYVVSEAHFLKITILPWLNYYLLKLRLSNLEAKFQNNAGSTSVPVRGCSPSIWSLWDHLLSSTSSTGNWVNTRT